MSGMKINLSGGKIGKGAAIGVQAGSGGAIAVGKNAHAAGSGKSSKKDAAAPEPVDITVSGDVDIGDGAAFGVRAGQGGNIAIGENASAGGIKPAESEMAKILRKLNLEELIPKFTEEKIEVKGLGELSNEDLKELGVKMGDRQKIRDACAAAMAKRPADEAQPNDN